MTQNSSKDQASGWKSISRIEKAIDKELFPSLELHLELVKVLGKYLNLVFWCSTIFCMAIAFILVGFGFDQACWLQWVRYSMISSGFGLLSPLTIFLIDRIYFIIVRLCSNKKNVSIDEASLVV